MQRFITILILCSLWCAGASGQTVPSAQTAAPSANTPAAAPTTSSEAARKAQSATTEKRPDAVYPKPSGQDSQPTNSANRPSKASKRATHTTAPVLAHSGSKAASPNQGKSTAAPYTGAAGKRSNPGTACSTARVTQSGALDCGTGGDGATAGKIVTK